MSSSGGHNLGCSLTLCSPNCNSKTPKKCFCSISVLPLFSVDETQAHATGPMRSGDGGHSRHKEKGVKTTFPPLRNLKLSSKVTFLKLPVTLYSAYSSQPQPLSFASSGICDFVHLRVPAAINPFRNKVEGGRGSTHKYAPQGK